MTRQAYIDRDRRFAFFWSPKAGNTSLAAWLIRGLWPELLISFGATPSRRVLKESGHWAPAEEALQLVRRDGYACFALVRDPFTRAASVFFDKFVFNGRRPLWRFEELETFAQKAYLEISGREPDAPYVGVSFLQYLHHVRSRIASRDLEPDLNPHWNTQVPYLYRSAAFEYGQVVHLERVATELPPVAQRLGIAHAFPTLRPRQLPPAESGDVADVSSVVLLRDGLSPSADSLLVPAARALIAEAYEIDFAFFGYPTDPVTSAAMEGPAVS